MAVATIEPSVAVRTIAIIAAANTSPRPGRVWAARRSWAEGWSTKAHSRRAEQNRSWQFMRDPRQGRGRAAIETAQKPRHGAGNLFKCALFPQLISTTGFSGGSDEAWEAARAGGLALDGADRGRRGFDSLGLQYGGGRGSRCVDGRQRGQQRSSADEKSNRSPIRTVQASSSVR